MTDRKPAEWMCTLDERILEHLEREGWAMPRHIERATTMNASKERVSERLRVLTRVGLVGAIFERSRMYELTNEGVMYLGGDLDAEHLPRPDPRVVSFGMIFLGSFLSGCVLLGGSLRSLRK